VISPPATACFFCSKGRVIVVYERLGTFTSEVYEAPHWDHDKHGVANYAEISWDRIVADADLLPVPDLIAKVPGLTWGRIQGSGVRLPAPGDRALEDLWLKHVSDSGQDTGSNA